MQFNDENRGGDSAKLTIFCHFSRLGNDLANLTPPARLPKFLDDGSLEWTTSQFLDGCDHFQRKNEEIRQNARVRNF